jgi:hemerythrin-like metal-binding protein
MAFITWTSMLEIPHDVINEQHQKLVESINAFHCSVENDWVDENPAEVLTFLADYVAEHFAYEEELMDKHGFANAQAHRAEHIRLRAEVAERAKAVLENGEEVDSMELLKFLKRWLVEHIMGWDSELATCVSGKA